MEIKSYKYNKGIKFEEKSPYVVVEGTETLGVPQYIFVPLKQFKGAIPLLMVEIGERVHVGSVLAKGRTGVILSPATGEVVAVEKRPSAHGGVCDHVIIATSTEDRYYRLPELKDTQLSPAAILKRIFECGLINNDGIPLYKKLTIEEGEVVEAIVINVCTDEPFVNSTVCLLNTMPQQIIKAIEYLVKAVGVNTVKIAVTDNSYAGLDAFLEALKEYKGLIKFEVAKVGNNYPVGDEEILTSVLRKGKKVPNGKAKPKMIVIDAAVCFSVYQAVARGYADDYKLITVLGVGQHGNEQKNVWVKVGTTIGDILIQTRFGDYGNITKIVVGGPMRGKAVSGFDVAITKTTKSVLFMSGMEGALNLESKCIGCGKCVKVCPINLLPYRLDELSQNEDYDGCKKFGVEACTKCGCCAYVCPTRRHLVQRISYAKDVIDGKGGGRV